MALSWGDGQGSLGVVGGTPKGWGGHRGPHGTVRGCPPTGVRASPHPPTVPVGRGSSSALPRPAKPRPLGPAPRPRPVKPRPPPRPAAQSGSTETPSGRTGTATATGTAPAGRHGRVPQLAGGAGPEHHSRGPGAAEVGLQGGHPQRGERGHRHQPPLVRLPGEAQQTGQRQPVVHRAHLRDLTPPGPADHGGAVPHPGPQDLRGGRGGHQAHPHPQRQEVQGHHPAALGRGDHQTGPPAQESLRRGEEEEEEEEEEEGCAPPPPCPPATSLAPGRGQAGGAGTVTNKVLTPPPHAGAGGRAALRVRVRVRGCARVGVRVGGALCYSQGTPPSPHWKGGQQEQGPPPLQVVAGGVTGTGTTPTPGLGTGTQASVTGARGRRTGQVGREVSSRAEQEGGVSFLTPPRQAGGWCEFVRPQPRREGGGTAAVSPPPQGLQWVGGRGGDVGGRGSGSPCAG